MTEYAEYAWEYPNGGIVQSNPISLPKTYEEWEASVIENQNNDVNSMLNEGRAKALYYRELKEEK